MARFSLQYATTVKSRVYREADSRDFATLEVYEADGASAVLYFKGSMIPASADMASVFEAHSTKSPLLPLLDLVLAAINDPRSETLEALVKGASDASAYCCDACTKYADLVEVGADRLCKDCAEAVAERDWEMRQDALADQADAVRSAQYERALTEAGRGHLIGGAK